jgi:hypothetical protein
MRHPILAFAIAFAVAATCTAFAKDKPPRDAQSGIATGKRMHTSTSNSGKGDTHPSPPPKSGWDLKENKKM